MYPISFSILIPAFKAKYLAETIGSCLKQVYKYFEIIVVDDCSPEDLGDIIKLFDDARIKYYRNTKNCGAINVVDNWNNCLSYSNGDYVICIGDDDRLLPNALYDLAQLIDKYPQLNVYHIQTQIIDEVGCVTRQLELRPELEKPLEMLRQRFLGRSQYIGDFCFKAHALKQEGGFYFLPLAWTSDDLTVFRATLPDGIANTNKVGFEYRENRYSISENTKNDGLKIEALRLSERWYLSVFTKLSTNPAEISAIRELMICRYQKMYIKHIYGEIINNPIRLFYWLLYSKRVHVSHYMFLKIMVKCLRVIF